MIRQPKVWISLLILLVIGLHALPVLSYQGHRQTRWPFLAWAMYARSYPPGPVQVVERTIVAATASGEEHAITPYVVGLSKPAFRNAYLVPLAKGDSAAARELLRRLNAGRDVPFAQVTLGGVQSTLSDTGVVRDPLPRYVYRADAGREGTP
jgi:hypothetical protein